MVVENYIRFSSYKYGQASRAAKVSLHWHCIVARMEHKSLEEAYPDDTKTLGSVTPPLLSQTPSDAGHTVAVLSDTRLVVLAVGMTAIFGLTVGPSCSQSKL